MDIITEIDNNSIRENENKIKKVLLEAYEKLNTYEEKLIFIYNIILKSQEHFYKYTNNNLRSSNALNELLRKFRNTKISNESDFIDFINDNIIIPSNSGHLFLKPTEIVSIDDNLVHKSSESPFSYQIIGENTMLLTIKSFSRNNMDAAERFFGEVQSLLSDKIENIIIDIRNNGGGSDEYFKFFDMFSDKDIYYTSHYANVFSNAEYKLQRRVIRKGTDKKYKRYLLVNDKVFSTSDTLARICKDSGFATIIGTKTAGEGYGNSIITLPLTTKNYNGNLTYGKNVIVNGVELVFPVEVPLNEYGMIDYENLYSTIPNIECLDAFALETALQLIELEKEKKFN